MPDPDPPATTTVHDWTRVGGFWSSFHLKWIGELYEQLNDGLLPDGYYAEAHTGGEFRVELDDRDGGGDEVTAAGAGGRRFYGDVLGLHEQAAVEPTGMEPTGMEPTGMEPAGMEPAGAVALAERPPATRFVEQMPPGRAPRSVAVRHGSGGRLVSLIQVVSPGNRDGRGKVAAFCDKVEAALRGEVHVLLIDLFPPTPLVPAGMHGAVAARFGLTYDPPPGEPLTCAAYRSAGEATTSFVEPLAVGAAVPTMPLFLTPDRYVNLPLADSYAAAYRPTPRVYRRLLEAADPPAAGRG